MEGLRNLPEALSPFSERVLVFDAATTSAALAGSLRAFWRGGVRSTSSVFELAMSRKSASEIKCIEEAMRRDGVALTEFYAELDERLAAGEMLSECAAASLLHEHRSKQDGFLGESFETIAAFGANAAMPHYVPKAGSDAMLAGDGLLLIDSGGQYWCGTTDVTRMTPIGRLSQEDRREAGLVTRAMLKLARQRFPEGARGASVDAAARTVLWDEGVDYGHGTGHGVGFVLNVHEGPVRLSPGCLEPLAAGNVLSDEPGLYREGVRGIRVENMLVAVPDAHACGMLRWKALTCVPIDVRTLPEEGIGLETADLNAYNAWVCKRLSPYLSERALRWLEKAARPIPII